MSNDLYTHTQQIADENQRLALQLAADHFKHIDLGDSVLLGDEVLALAERYRTFLAGGESA